MGGGKDIHDCNEVLDVLKKVSDFAKYFASIHVILFRIEQIT